MRGLIRGWSLSVACVVLGMSQASACPMCKLALETDDPLPRAYMVSILFMLGAISTMFGGVGLLCYWITRYERSKLEEAGYRHLFENGATEAVTQPQK